MLRVECSDSWHCFRSLDMMHRKPDDARREFELVTESTTELVTEVYPNFYPVGAVPTTTQYPVLPSIVDPPMMGY